MSDKIASLFGAAPPVPQQEPRVIARLEGLLQRARDGQMVGIAWVVLDQFGHGEFGRSGTADSDRMIACAARLLHDMLQDEREAYRD